MAGTKKLTELDKDLKKWARDDIELKIRAAKQKRAEFEELKRKIAGNKPLIWFDEPKAKNSLPRSRRPSTGWSSSGSGSRKQKRTRGQIQRAPDRASSKKRSGRIANASGAVPVYCRTSVVTRSAIGLGSIDDGNPAETALIAKSDYVTRKQDCELERSPGEPFASEPGNCVPADESTLSRTTDYFERQGAFCGAEEEVLAIVTNTGKTRKQRNATWAAVAGAERSWREGGMNKTRADSAVLINTQILEMPHQLPVQEMKKCVEAYGRIFAEAGLFYLAVIHAPPKNGDPRNFHVHLMHSHRPFERKADGAIAFAKRKCRDFRGPSDWRRIRRQYVAILNSVLARNGITKRYFAGRYMDEGIDLKTGIHLGPAAMAMERKRSEVGGGPQTDIATVWAEREASRGAFLDGHEDFIAASGSESPHGKVPLGSAPIKQSREGGNGTIIENDFQPYLKSLGRSIAVYPIREGQWRAVPLTATDQAKEKAKAFAALVEGAQQMPEFFAWVEGHKQAFRQSWTDHTVELLRQYRLLGGNVSLNRDGAVAVGLGPGREWAHSLSWLRDTLRKQHLHSLKEILLKEHAWRSRGAGRDPTPRDPMK